MFVGIDLGTSSVKAVLVDEAQHIIGVANAALSVESPKALWSEQDPACWWEAANQAMGQLKAEHGPLMSKVAGVGLSGQMHGATLLDKTDSVLRPCILWNDGRSGAQCEELEDRVNDLRAITGNMAMPGFTAPKVLWVAENEPQIFDAVARVLLPKDYLRLLMTGEALSDMSDASATLWLDVGARAWSDKMLAATGLDRSAMPGLVEGSDPAGVIRRKVAAEWGLSEGVVVAGGGGDQPVGAAGVGTVVPGRAFISLGTSGVYFTAGDSFQPNPDRAVHAMCHCLPGLWQQMAVMLNGASCLSWVTQLTGAGSEAALLSEIEADGEAAAGVPLFLPYLTGERTPLNDPYAKGVFFGLSSQTDRAALGRAVLEGVAFAFGECQDAMIEGGAVLDHVSVIGGGARSALWGRILAAALNRPLSYHVGGELGPAFGAARLGRLAVTGEAPEDICVMPPIDQVIEPDENLRGLLVGRMERWRTLYPALEPLFKQY